jgi:hypothetical protein
MVRVREGKRSLLWNAIAVNGLAFLLIFTLSRFLVGLASDAIIQEAGHAGIGSSLLFGFFMSIFFVAWAARRSWMTCAE